MGDKVIFLEHYTFFTSCYSCHWMIIRYCVITLCLSCISKRIFIMFSSIPLILTCHSLSIPRAATSVLLIRLLFSTKSKFSETFSHFVPYLSFRSLSLFYHRELKTFYFSSRTSSSGKHNGVIFHQQKNPLNFVLNNYFHYLIRS